MDKKFVGLSIGLVCIGVLIGAFVFYSFQWGFFRSAELNIDVGTMSLHMHAEVEFANGTILDLGYHTGVLTTIGKNWIEDQLGDSPSTNPAKWISLSTSTSTPLASWTQIPTEITTGGLERATGTYTSTGDGVWTISLQFTASATHTNVQLCGFQYAVSGDGNLMWADTFTPVTLSISDKLTVTGTTTVT